MSADAPDRWGLVARDVRTFDVGEYVLLPKPRKLMRADGSVVQITTRHSLTTAMIDRVRDEVFDFVRESGVGAVAIERVESVFLREGAAGSAVASAILKAGYVCEAIRQKLDVQGFHVVPVRAAAWRAALGKSWHDRIDGTVVLPGAEAAGCALWLVEPPPPPRTPRVRRAPSETRDALRKRRTQAEREATGCTCDGRGRHKRACPLAKQGAKFGRKKGGKNAKTPEISLEKSS